ncbi:MAG TPA: hypothetical protein QF761_03470, partial [Pirellulales bacterium]|nr:hypothetical protein [Pirellulales bacterium]
MAKVPFWFRSLIRRGRLRRSAPRGASNVSAGRGSVRPLSAETLEQRHLLSGVTLITHGHT